MNDKQFRDTPAFDGEREDRILKAMTYFHQDVMDEIYKLRTMLKDTFEKFPFAVSQYDNSTYRDEPDSSSHESESYEQETEENVPSLQETFDNITGIISACHPPSSVTSQRKPAALDHNVFVKFTPPPASKHSFTFPKPSHSRNDNIESESFEDSSHPTTSKHMLFTQDDSECQQLKTSVKNVNISSSNCFVKKKKLDQSLGLVSTCSASDEEFCKNLKNDEAQRLLTNKPVRNSTSSFTKNEPFRDEAKLKSGGNVPIRTQIEYKCQICGKLFTRRSNLNHHIKIHTGDKPFKCTYCSKRFTWRSSMKYHLRTHTRDKPCKCGVCGAMLSSWSNFRAHIKIHTEEKPYACQLCKTSFTRLYSFKRHMRHYHPELPLE